MVDAMTDKPNRKPAGAAVPGAVDRPVNYPKTLTMMVSEDTFDAIAAEKKRTGRSKGDIGREWLETGRAAHAASA
ncbi:hypothetical protein SEA_FUZZBUSTER_72 [Microbacterium phage FuzzBuster]|uniref:Uncharacterized protein n=1 Tax=Microbacterium phage FuzzBuster TaxID=2590935 RepID=A0A516KV46_9CAUD|nr:hypothetical protein SEA_FUZZBUSTER_72 [Microbacterium phage FuzzBuster]